MVATTTISDYEMNQPTGDRQIDELLQEVRKGTGADWQLVVRTHRDKRLFSKDRVWQTWSLYKYVGGCLPWQVLMCVSDQKTAFCYLCGLASGLDKVQGVLGSWQPQARKVRQIREDLKDFDGDRRGILYSLEEAEKALVETCLKALPGGEVDDG